MAPRKPKADDDAASTTSTDLPAVLKPRTEKAKVEKAKSDKPKVAKPKAPKKEKEKVEDEEAKPKKKAVRKDSNQKDDEDSEWDADAAASKPVKAKAKVAEGKSVGGGGGGGGGGAAGKGDGKEKVKPVNGEEAMELIRTYLKRENRPYSATEVSANLHGKVRCYTLPLRVASVSARRCLGAALTGVCRSPRPSPTSCSRTWSRAGRSGAKPPRAALEANGSSGPSR